MELYIGDATSDNDERGLFPSPPPSSVMPIM